MKKLKLFSGNKKQSYQNYLNPRLIIGGISENGFKPTLRSKKKKKKKKKKNVCSGHLKIAFFSDFQIFE